MIDMAQGKLRIKRKGFTTSAGTRVKHTSFMTHDYGKKGRSSIPEGAPRHLVEGRLNNLVRRITGKHHYTDLTMSEIRKFVILAVNGRHINQKSLLGMLGTQVARRKNATHGSIRLADKKKFQYGMHVIGLPGVGE